MCCDLGAAGDTGRDTFAWGRAQGLTWDCPGGSIPSWVLRKGNQSSEVELAFTRRHMHIDTQFPLYIMFFAESKEQAA